MDANNLIFMKLGGSLITHKDRPRSARIDVIERLAGEIVQAKQALPALRLVLGHGSGSFGHVPARRYRTREGVYSDQEWSGFLEVWREASALNSIVVDVLSRAGLPVLAFPPSAGVIGAGGRLIEWNLEPLNCALGEGLIPLVFGDVAFDRQIGGTIFSTEDLFVYLAPHLKPERILLVGQERGVWTDYPQRTKLIESLTTENLADLKSGIGASAATDVTGGMYTKVTRSLDICKQVPGLTVSIFSGEQHGAVQQALGGKHLGTLIKASS